jgi:hypothetical protein
MLALQKPTEPFKPYFFVGSPGDAKLESAYRAALSILKLSPVIAEVVEESRLDDFAGGIAKEIHETESAS